MASASGRAPGTPAGESPPAGSKEHPFLRLGERFAGRVGAILAGVILMAIGVGMGVTVIMLPVGVVIGFVGLFLFLWGVFAPAFRKGREV